MGKIIVLDENTSNKIAAGEVVERPASVVKELIENSIDAGATSISVEIKNGGITFIKINDNGSGIDEDDVEIAFERHATSKIKNSEDLDSISTLGFRGEALASIASIAAVELTSRVKSNQHGTIIKIRGGSVKEVSKIGCPVGTTFVVKELFYNTPARFKFLKKDSTEAGYISDIITRVALSKPHISLKLISNNSLVLQTPGNNDLLSAIYSIYGKEATKSVLEINYTDNKVKMTGFAGKPEIARSSRNQQSIFVNGRYIKSKLITSAIDEAYKTYLLKNKYAFIVLNLEVNPMLVDVNVHPTKMEIRFSDEQEIFRSVFHAISSALIGKDLIKTYVIEKHDNPFIINNEHTEKGKFTQQNLNLENKLINEPKTADYTRDSAIPTQKAIISDEILPLGTIAKENINNNLSSSRSLMEDLTSKNIDTQGHNEKVTPKLQNNAEVNIIADKARKSDDIDKSGEVNKLKEYYGIDKSSEVNKAKEFSDINMSNEESKSKDSNDASKPKGENDFKKANEIDEVISQKIEVKRNLINFNNALIIGQLFSTYILLQSDNDVILIDQHAAHERIRYEFYKEKFLNNESLSQDLLSPIVVELTNQELKFVVEEQDFFDRLGFKYESFGNNSIILRSVPMTDTGTSIKSAFLEVVDSVLSKGKHDYRKTADETIYTIACKSAIKANKKMDDMEIKSLLMELSKIDNPYTCPHGRPTIVKLTKYELEKMFKRII